MIILEEKLYPFHFNNICFNTITSEIAIEKACQQYQIGVLCVVIQYPVVAFFLYGVTTRFLKKYSKECGTWLF